MYFLTYVKIDLQINDFEIKKENKLKLKIVILLNTILSSSTHYYLLQLILISMPILISIFTNIKI